MGIVPIHGDGEAEIHTQGFGDIVQGKLGVLDVSAAFSNKF